MIFQNPRILRFDAAFQLSFLSTLGLIYVAPRIEPAVNHARIFLWKKITGTPETAGIKKDPAILAGSLWKISDTTNRASIVAEGQ